MDRNPDVETLVVPPPPAENRAEGDVDRLVQQRFFARPGRRRFCVDVGAARPDFLSISARFRECGWRVLAVEPNPAFCELYRARGWEVVPCACGEHDQDGVDFFVVNSRGAAYGNGALSFESYSSLGIKPSYRAIQGGLDTRAIKVNVRRLDTLLAQYAPEERRIDLLLVDVEGWELEVLRGLDLARHRPRVIVLENLFDNLDVVAFLLERGYERWRRVAPNDVYVRRGAMPRALFLRWLAWRDRRLGFAGAPGARVAG